MALEYPWVSVLVYDIEPELTPALERLHGQAREKLPGRGHIRVGKRKGYVTRLTEEIVLQHLGEHGFKVCDGLVSSFSCAPYSSIGSRKLGDDIRSLVCVAVVNMIKWLAKGCYLQWFVLENVPGIMKRKRGDSDSFADWLMRFIIDELKRAECDGWHIVLRPHTSADCALVQHRERVFVRGDFASDEADGAAAHFAGCTITHAATSWVAVNS